MTLVSVIIPTHNRPKLLRRAVESVERQTYSPIELIVVNSPETSEINGTVKTADIYTSQYVDAEAESVSAARNIGVERANGEYIAFLDDDDEWEPEKIERQLNRVDKTGAEVCHTGVKKVSSEGALRAVSQPTHEGKVTKQLLLPKKLYDTPSAVLVSKEIFEQAGGFDEELTFYEEMDFYIRISLYSDFCTVPDPLVIKYAETPMQMSQDIERQRSNIDYFLKKHRDLAQEFDQSTESQMIAGMWHSVGRTAANQGMYITALRLFLKSIKNSPTYIPNWMWIILISGGPLSFKTAQFIKRSFVQIRGE